jgi:hypothetical protein
MGFNKKYIGDVVIEKLILSPELIGLYLRADSLIFNNEYNKKKFEEITNEYLKRKSLI